MAPRWIYLGACLLPGWFSALLRLATSSGDEVLLQEPVYNMFHSVIEGNGRRVVPSDLVYEGGKYPLTGRTLKTSWPVLLSGR